MGFKDQSLFFSDGTTRRCEPVADCVKNRHVCPNNPFNPDDVPFQPVNLWIVLFSSFRTNYHLNRLYCYHYVIIHYKGHKLSISSNLPKKHPTTKYDSVPSCSRSLDLLASHVVYRRNPSRVVRVVRKGSSRSHVQWGFPVDPARSQPVRSKTQKQNCQGWALAGAGGHFSVDFDSIAGIFGFFGDDFRIFSPSLCPIHVDLEDP